MRKKICITLSRVFPKTHNRAGEPTGFSDKLASGKKIHTIRRNYDLWRLNAEKMQRGGYALSIRQWIDKPYRSKQREIHVQNELSVFKRCICTTIQRKIALMCQ